MNTQPANAEFHLYLYGPGRGPIESSFEAAESRLTELPLLHFEPDGSFVWTRDSGAQQVFGMLYDAASKIQYADLRGRCECETWRQLCQAIAGRDPATLVVLQLPQQRWHDLQSFQSQIWPADNG